MTSWKLVDLKNRWDTLNNDLNLVSENLALKSADLPAVSSQSSNEEFHLLVASLRALRADINDFGSDIKTQTDTLSLDVRHFYDLAKEYDTEIEIYRKGREQAFGLYDNLSTEHKGLLHEFESLKAEFKVVSRDFDGARSRLEQIELESSILRKSNETLANELSEAHIELMGCKKRIELLEEENEKLSNIKDHESTDRNTLIEQLSKEIKSRNDATVLAEAARNELSRVLGEAEEDRRLREKADLDRDEAIGSVQDLNQVIEDLKAQVEEGERQYKHEMVMRHKIEENLLDVEQRFKDLETLLAETTAERDAAKQVADEFTVEKTKILEEKEVLVNQIAAVASQMAQEKLDSAKLMDTLQSAQTELASAQQLSADSVEKAKGMERVVNQLISEKADLESQVERAQYDLSKIIQDNKDVVGVRQGLETKIASLESQIAETTKLFESEKQLKSEACLAKESAEKSAQKYQLDLVHVKENGVELVRERDELKRNLESVQKVLQSERHSRLEIEKSHSALSDELFIVKGKFQDESKLREDLVKSLDAETRSKNEIIKQLEDVGKNGEKAVKNFEKIKTECDALKDKVKDFEKSNKDLSKEVDSLKKDIAKGATETEKALRQKDEIQKKLDTETALAKENEKGWSTEKSEHEKTYKAYYEVKGKCEKLERELEALKGSFKQAEDAFEAEKSEHSKTYKAYEAERNARAKYEEQLTSMHAQVSELNAQIKSSTAEKIAVEKRAQKLESQLSSETKSETDASNERLQFDEQKRSLENQLISLKRAKEESESTISALRVELEKNKIKMNNFELENKQLLKRLEKFAAELADEQRAKNQLLQATMQPAPAVATGNASPSNATSGRRSSLDNIFSGSLSPLERLNRAISGSISK